jgi:hypothetical protein
VESASGIERGQQGEKERRRWVGEPNAANAVLRTRTLKSDPNHSFSPSLPVSHLSLVALPASARWQRFDGWVT